MTLPLSRFNGFRPVPHLVNPATSVELSRIESQLTESGNTLEAVRQLRGIITFDPEARRAWELGVRAFDHVRYSYSPPQEIKRALDQGRAYLAAGDRLSCLQIAKQLVMHDPELKQGWELGLASFR